MLNENVSIYKAGYKTSGKESQPIKSFQFVFRNLWCKLPLYITQMWHFILKGKWSLMKSILTQLNINCYIKFFWCQYFYHPIVLSTYFTCPFCSQFILQPSAS